MKACPTCGVPLTADEYAKVRAEAEDLLERIDALRAGVVLALHVADTGRGNAAYARVRSILRGLIAEDGGDPS